MPLLSVRDVTLRFGGIVALDAVSFDVEAGTISGLIGPNGAGKTTVFNVITRLYRPDEGELELEGESLLRTPPHRIVSRGIARTFQNINLFRTMSVLENVLLGAHARGRDVGEQEALEMLDYVGLRDRAGQNAAALPYGTQKRVEFARALMARPRLLLLDEPAGGLNHEEVEELGGFIQRVRADHDLTVLLVEHHMNLVMSISDHVTVLSFGRQIAAGTPAAVRADPAVIEAYLGVEDGGDGTRGEDGDVGVDRGAESGSES
jgi:branched-chain amino acid transport system ATP-binding protein